MRIVQASGQVTLVAEDSDDEGADDDDRVNKIIRDQWERARMQQQVRVFNRASMCVCVCVCVFGVVLVMVMVGPPPTHRRTYRRTSMNSQGFPYLTLHVCVLVHYVHTLRLRLKRRKRSRKKRSWKENARPQSSERRKSASRQPRRPDRQH